MDNTTAPEHKKRLDVYIAETGLVRSRSVAADLVKRGKVIVNGNIEKKPSLIVFPADKVEVSEAMRFVSRAGDKLDGALDAWKIDVDGMTAIDIGSSTGGFVDCLLKRGAEKVIAIEVGTDQLDASLRGDPRIELHEQTDVRRFSLPKSSPLADLIVADVSFISLSLIFPKAYELLRKGCEMIALVKPQFEVGREIAHKRKGVIRDEKERRTAFDRVVADAKSIGFKVVAYIDSPLDGEGGNREYLLRLKK
ncbi:MAG: TlyA family RNA methyltransferase [bacterium]|nr:TlyA family RNA methyltransferase [bacterium]